MKARPRRPKHPRRVSIDIETLLRELPTLEAFHAAWTAQGYGFARGRLQRCKDGSFTGRFVWRHPSETVSTVSLTVRGIVVE